MSAVRDKMEPAGAVRLDADKVLAALGRCPPYQWLLVAVIGTVWVFVASHTMLPTLVADYHPYACVPSGQNASNASVVYGTPCERSDDESADDAPADIRTCGESDANYTLLFDPSFGDTMVSEFKLVCGQRYRSYLVLMILNAGTAVALLPMSQLSDLFGRRPVFLACYWSAVALAIAIVYVPSFTLVLLLRFLIGCFMSGMGGGQALLVAEHSAPALRPVSLNLPVHILWPVSFMLAGLAAMLLPQWRRMSAALAYPFIAAAALCCIIVPKSLHWLVARRRADDALALSRKLERLNCATVDLARCHKKHGADGETTARPRRTLADVVKSPVLSMLTLLMCYIGFIMMLVYYGLSMISTRLSSDRFTGYFLSGAIELPAGLTATYITAKFSRRKVYVCSIAVQVLGLVTSLCLGKESPEWLRIAAYLVAKYGNSCAWGPFYVVAIEVAPTTVRNVVNGTVVLVGLTGSMAAPWVAGAIADIDAKLPNVIFVALSLLSILAMLALPETFNTELPEDMDDVRPGPLLGRWYKDKRPLSKVGTGTT